MVLSEISIRRPVFATVLSLVIVLFGLVSYTRLSVREYPRIDEPVVTRRHRPTAAPRPRSSSRRSRKPLEDSLAGHRGRRGDDARTAARRRSRITVRFTLEARSRRGRRRRARQGGARPRGSCPTRSTSRSSPRSRPTPSRSSTSPSSDRLSPLEVTDYVNRYVKAALPMLPGAADVRIFGERQVVDAHQPRPHAARRLQADGRRTSRTRSAARTSRFRRAASRASTREFTVVARDRRARRPSSSTTSSSRTSAAIPVRIRDVGNGRDRRGRRAHGLAASTARTSLNIGVIKQAVANPLDLSHGRARGGDRDQRGPAGRHEARCRLRHVGVHRPVDQAVFQTIVEAIVLVVLVIFFFLRTSARHDHPDRHDPGVADRRVRADVRLSASRSTR